MLTCLLFFDPPRTENEVVKLVPGTIVRFILRDGTCAVYIPDEEHPGQYRSTRQAHGDDKFLVGNNPENIYGLMQLLSVFSGLSFERVRGPGNSEDMVYRVVESPE